MDGSIPDRYPVGSNVCTIGNRVGGTGCSSSSSHPRPCVSSSSSSSLPINSVTFPGESAMGEAAAGIGCSLAGSISSSCGMYSGYIGSGTKVYWGGDCGSSWARRRDAWNSGNKDRSRTGKKEDSKALVTVDGEGVDWSNHSEDEDYTLMACKAQTQTQ
ncbi:hypothetical protein Tco_1506399, partial [Tanacetum coccineum]